MQSGQFQPELNPIELPAKMSMQKPVAVPTNNAFEDLSGISTSAFSNPYNALIAACEDDPVSGSFRQLHSKC